MVLQLKAHMIVVEICHGVGGMVKQNLVSPGLFPPLSSLPDPPGTPPTSEPAIVTTPLHQPTPIRTGMSLGAITNTCSVCTKYLYI